jgi:hypothetical protein
MAVNILEIIQMTKKKLKITTLAELTDKYVGKVGTASRDKFEYELKIDLIGGVIK